MGARWIAHGGWTIEIVVISGRSRYRLTNRGYLIGECRTTEELQALLARYGLNLVSFQEDDPECELSGRLAGLLGGPARHGLS